MLRSFVTPTTAVEHPGDDEGSDLGQVCVVGIRYIVRGKLTGTGLAQTLEGLFAATADAHHAAFIETDGDDPEWPLWYAQNLVDQLNDLLGANLTTSELVYLIVLVDKERDASAPGADWKKYWATFFLERYS